MSGLHLPNGYRENPSASSDQAGDTFWDEAAEERDDRFQAPVYRWAGELLTDPPPVVASRWATRAEVRPRHTVVDIGCGLATKLTRFVAPAADVVGVDQGSGVARARAANPGLTMVEGDLDDDRVWQDARRHHPDLVLCVDVIEHVADPSLLLTRLAALCGDHGALLVSTPDRSRLDGADPLGPPGNRRHIREWTWPEFGSLLADHGLKVVLQRHLLPRSYSLSIADARRLVGRARRGLAVPDQRSCQAVLAVPAAFR